MKHNVHSGAPRALALFTGALLIGCGGGDGIIQKAPPLILSIAFAAVSLAVAEFAELTVNISGGQHIQTLASCESTAPSVAVVAVSGPASGRGTGVGPGSTAITARVSNGRQVVASVAITAFPAIANLTVNPVSANLVIGRTVILVPALTRARGTITVSSTFNSSAPTIASVDAQGVVTGVA